MKVMGIGGSTHDLSTCILHNGQICIAIEEERISREKYSIGKRSMLFQGQQYCLNSMGCKRNELDLVIGNDLLSLLPKKVIEVNIGNIMLINHHLTHAASAYYVSGYDESAIMVIDAYGSLLPDGKQETVSFYHTTGKEFNVIKKVSGSPLVGENADQQFNSLGTMYSFFTKMCGFGSLEEGKTMGLAPYGKNTYVKELWKYINVNPDGDVVINITDNIIYEFLNSIMKGKKDEELFSIRADMAFAAQEVLEESVFILLNYLYDVTKCTKLCYAGGIALNSVLNGKIRKKTPFKDIFIQPAAGDGGTSLGAVLYGYYNVLDQPYVAKKEMKHAYLGKIYTDNEVEKILNESSDWIKWESLSDDEVTRTASRCISEGLIVGWFQGQSEIGPRALGHRSILADARIDDMKDKLNSRVKFRESFRPFAPSILLEYANEYFDIEDEISPFMLKVYNVRPDKKHVIPAVTHVDGTARVQTVDEESNGIYYRLIRDFYNLTKIPVILNTSFNIKGMPIVETPGDAMKCFNRTNIDVLFINHYFITKIK